MSPREVIQPQPGDKRYARRNEGGQFTENQVDVGKSLAADRRSKAKKVVPKGQGDRGDQKPAAKSLARFRNQNNRNYLQETYVSPH
jgi:hypothetical protein